MSKSVEKWYFTNKYSASAQCPHCEGIIRHEQWCASQNVNTRYAMAITADPELMTPGDLIILRGLGIIWPI